MLREAYNRVKIEGICSEIDISEKSFVKNGETVYALGGNIKVLVEQTINGAEQTNEIPVYVFASKYTKAGKINPSYESIEKVKNSFVSIAACGSKEQATKVRITTAKIIMNSFYNNAGMLVNTPRIQASFIGEAFGDFEPEASFSVEFMLSKMRAAVDRDGVEIEPKKLEIVALVPQYGGKIDEVTFVTSNPNVVNSIETYWEAGKCYKASGRVNFTSTTREILEEVDFGEPTKKRITVSVNDLVVTGGAQSPLDSEFAFDLDEVKAAMADRAARLEAMKTSAKKVTPAPETKKGLDLGF